jgi:hypothetical protein
MKVSVPRYSLESWARHIADPKQYANMLREHSGSIREQLKLEMVIYLELLEQYWNN